MTGNAAWRTAAALIVAALPARALEVSTRVSARQVDLGEPFQVTIAVDGGQLARTPEFPQGDYTVAGPQTSSQISIINGRQTGSISYTWQVTPHKPGTVSIPSFELMGSDGRAYRSAPVTITVTGPGQEPAFLVELTGPDRNIYPDQEFSIEVIVHVARLGGQYRDRDPFPVQQTRSLFAPAQIEVWPHLAIPWLSGVEGIEAPDVNAYLNGIWNRTGRSRGGFRINDLSSIGEPATFVPQRTNARRKGPDGTEREYLTYTLRLTYRAKDVGERRFAPVVAKGYILKETSGKIEPRKVFTTSGEVVVRVVPPPEAGRPPSFSGAIGRFTVSARASPTRARVGDPILLELLVKGSGDLGRIAAISLAQQKGFDSFKVYDDPTIGEKDGGKLFVYRIRPKDRTIREIPPIEFSSFDPRTEQYVTVATAPIPITVEEGETLLVKEEPTAPAGPPPEGQTLEATGRGIRADHGDLDAIEPQQPFRPGWLPLVLFGIAPPLAYALFAGLVVRRRSAAADPVRRRARLAWSRARERLAAARRLLAGDPAAGNAFYPALAEACIGFVADRRGLAEHGLTPAELRAELARAGVATADAESLLAIIDRCDAARFSPSSFSAEDRARDIAAATDLLRKLERAL